jgi:hypothetical protein
MPSMEMFNSGTQYGVHSAIGSEASLISIDFRNSASNTCGQNSSSGYNPWAPELPFLEYLFWNTDRDSSRYSPSMALQLSTSRPALVDQLQDGLTDIPGTLPFLHTYPFQPSTPSPSNPRASHPLPHTQCTGMPMVSHFVESIS